MTILNERLPVEVFAVSDFGISIEEFVDENKRFFPALPWDHYDVKKAQIQMIQKVMPNKDDALLQELADYFVSASKDVSEAYKNVQLLSGSAVDSSLLTQLLAVKPFRRRAISRFILTPDRDRSWQIDRIPALPLSQTDGKLVTSKGDLNIYLLPRNIPEIDDAAVSSAAFKTILKGISDKIYTRHPDITHLDINAHHVQLDLSYSGMVSNSPEGVHQDGFDYIVSALVVERENIHGGVSAIFHGEAFSPLFTTLLQPGFGLFQPDKDTDLWHVVSSISTLGTENAVRGYRSTIGFDITLGFSDKRRV